MRVKKTASTPNAFPAPSGFVLAGSTCHFVAVELDVLCA